MQLMRLKQDLRLTWMSFSIQMAQSVLQTMDGGYFTVSSQSFTSSSFSNLGERCPSRIASNCACYRSFFILLMDVKTIRSCYMRSLVMASVTISNEFMATLHIRGNLSSLVCTPSSRNVTWKKALWTKFFRRQNLRVTSASRFKTSDTTLFEPEDPLVCHAAFGQNSSEDGHTKCR